MKNKEAWLLGFMYADGCITDSNYVIVNLSTKDIDTLQKIKNLLDINTSIKTRINGKYSSSLISLKCKNKAEYFIAKGCTPRKSLTLDFPTSEQVDNNNLSHFIRGYFDGDGCITYRKTRNEAKVNFKGTESFLTKLKNILLSINCTCSIYKQNNSKIWSLDISGYNNIILFLEFIYKDSDEEIRMSRKYLKAIEIFKNIETLRKKKNKLNQVLSI